MYLLEDRYLFTGDSLAWNAKTRSLEAFRDVCWYDWSEQLRSLHRLFGETFSWILAGHGEYPSKLGRHSTPLTRGARCRLRSP